MSDADNKELNRTPPPMFQSQSQSATGKADAAEKAAFKPDSLLSGYQPDSPVFDEFLADDGQPRAHYAGLLAALQELGPAELKRRQETVRAVDPRAGHHLQCLWRPAGHGASVAARPDSVGHRAGRMAFARSRVDPTRDAAEQHSRRLLRRAGTHPLALAVAGDGFWRSRIFCGPATASVRRRESFCIFMPPTLRARRTATGGWFPTARRFRPAPAMRWQTGWSRRAFCRNVS